MCPPVSPCKGAFVVHPPRTMRVFLVWKRRYADVRAGTQAPPLRFRLGDYAWTGIQVFVYPKSEKFHKKQRSASND